MSFILVHIFFILQGKYGLEGLTWLDLITLHWFTINKERNVSTIKLFALFSGKTPQNWKITKNDGRLWDDLGLALPLIGLTWRMQSWMKIKIVILEGKEENSKYKVKKDRGKLLKMHVCACVIIK